MLGKIFKSIFSILAVVFGILLFGYLGDKYVMSNKHLLSKENCLIFAEDILGDRLHPETCSRLSYLKEVEMFSSANNEDNYFGSFAFKFHPII